MCTYFLLETRIMKTRKTYLITFLLTCCSLFLSAQGWEITFGGVLDPSWGLQTLQTDDGNYVACGAHLGDFTGAVGGWYTKFNEQGDTLWFHAFAYNSNNAFIAKLSDNSFLAMGLDQSYPPLESQVNFKKLSNDGTIIWDTTPSFNTSSGTSPYGALPLNDGSFIFLGAANGPSTRLLAQIDGDGNILWENEIDFVADLYGESDNGGFIFTDSDDNNVYIYETDGNGELINATTIPTTGETQGIILLENDETILISRDSPSPDTYRVRQTKLNAQLDIVSSDTIWNGNYIKINSVTALEDGLLMSGSTAESPDNGEERDGVLIETKFDGKVVLNKVLASRPGSQAIGAAVPSHLNGYIATGSNRPTVFGIAQAYILKTNSQGDIYTNSITGEIAIDQNNDCQINPGEDRLSEWMIIANNANQDNPYVATTDVDGNYELLVDSGDYVVSLIPLSVYWDACVNDVNLSFSGFYNDDSLDFSVDATIDCPGMAVSSTAATVRPCFERPVHVEFCNYGTITAENALLEITLDPLLTPVSSTVPWTSIGPDNTVLWELGDLEPLECGSLVLNVFLDCDATVGISYCIESHVYPDSLCAPTSPLWSGAFLEVSGVCQDSNLYFQIKNIGNAPMQQSSNYIIVEDAVLLMINATPLLNPGEFINIPATSNGSTYAIVVDQVPNAPGNSRPFAVIEDCGENGSGDVSVNLGNQFFLDDAAPYVDIDCPIAINSFDPNDKQGFPTGLTEEHYIEPETPIDYLIRFQNTGTDTAFTVVVTDLLDPSFDISTFQRGTSSHPYELDISGDGVLRFTFNDIMLPDSNVNEAASNGFVSFTITPHKDVPPGTVIKNEAAIYFDFNDFILTNETFHTIVEDFIDVTVGTTEHPTLSGILISVYPNPFMDNATFEIQGHTGDNYLLEIFDVAGRLVRSERHGQPTFEFKKDGIKEGLYFYRLTTLDGLLNTGKIMVK